MDDLERKAVKLVRDEFVLNEARLYEHISSTFRWLMATLFAANGGALIALFDRIAFRSRLRDAAVSFAIGLVCSILVGALSAFGSYRASVKITVARAKMDQALIENGSAEELLPVIRSFRPNWKTWWPTYAALGSLLFLIIGLTETGLAFAPRY